MKLLNPFTVALIAGIFCSTPAVQAGQIKQFQQCLGRLVNLNQFLRNIELNLNAALDSVCGKVPEITQCYKNLMDAAAVSRNFTPDERQNTETLIKILGSMFNFICDQRGSFEELQSNGGLQCVATNYPKVRRCADYSFPAMRPHAAVQIPYFGIMKKFGTVENGCTNFNTYRRCSIQVLESICQSLQLTKVFDDLFEQIEEDLCGASFNNSPVSLADAATALSTTAKQKTNSLRESCKRIGGPTTVYDIAGMAPPIFVRCFESLVNVTEFQVEMEEARRHGELDTMYAKYCRKVPALKGCIKSLSRLIEPCLDVEPTKIFDNITDAILKSICFNDGDRIAMFIAAGGIECFRANEKAVTTCANESLSSYIPSANDTGSAGFPSTSIPHVVMDPKQCTDIKTLKTCTVKVLEDCIDPTPANVVESLFNLIEKKTGCSEIKILAERTGSGSGGSAESTATADPKYTPGDNNSYSSNVKEACQKDAKFITSVDLRNITKGYKDYITTLGTMTQIVTEMIAAIPQGNLDTVLENKCAQVSATKDYLKSITDTVVHCLDPMEKDSVYSIYNLASSVLKYFCNDRCPIPKI